MNCLCSKLPQTFYLDEAPDGFVRHLLRQDAANWMVLYSCPTCGALWVVDEWDKYQWQVAGRITSRENWAGDTRIVERKQLLVASRNGLTDEECLWSGCSQRRVKGVVFCVDHLWEMGQTR